MYRGRLKRDFDIWIDKGILEPVTAQDMLREYDARQSVFSLGAVLLVLAAVLLSASILMVIAANWDDIPRLARIAGIIALIWSFHLGAAFCISRNAPVVASGLLILGSASFGGAIALVAQLYHLSGDQLHAALLWFSMTAIAAALFRSSALAGMAGVLSWVVFASVVDQSGIHLVLPDAAVIVVVGAIVAGLLVWTHASRLEHLVYLLGLSLLFWLCLDHEDATRLVAIVGFIVFVAVALRPSPLFALASRMGASPAFYSLAVTVMALFFLHVQWDHLLAAKLLLAVATLGLAVVALALAGRDNGGVRALAYVTFAGEVLYLAFEMIDTMLGTSGFFLVAGLVVAVLAFVVIKMEKLFAARARKRSLS